MSGRLALEPRVSLDSNGQRTLPTDYKPPRFSQHYHHHFRSCDGSATFISAHPLVAPVLAGLHPDLFSLYSCVRGLDACILREPVMLEKKQGTKKKLSFSFRSLLLSAHVRSHLVICATLHASYTRSLGLQTPCLLFVSRAVYGQYHCPCPDIVCGMSGCFLSLTILELHCAVPSVLTWFRSACFCTPLQVVV